MTLGTFGLGEQFAFPALVLTLGSKGEAAEAQLHAEAPKSKSSEKSSWEWVGRPHHSRDHSETDVAQWEALEGSA